VNEILTLDLDVIIGVDGGGDSISGGVDHHGDPNLARDIQMKKIFHETRIPFYHVVVGLCIDGETTFEDMSWHLERNRENYRGYFSVEECVPIFEMYCSMLGKTRTPNIVVRAFYEEYKRINKKSVHLKDTEDYLVQLDRGIQPVIPVSWIVNAFVFIYDGDILNI